VARLFDATSGDVLIDGTRIDQINLDKLRSSIGYVPQDVFLFSDSIANNISFGLKDNITRERIEQAAKDAVIYDNIMEFKEGFETVVGERGVTLSGGQKQRVSIARAIIREPKILIFDDCLSAVDTETEDQILKNLRRIMQGRTSILVSHRVSTVRHADKIIVLQNGSIAEEGTHQALIDKKGIYFDLYRKQLLEDEKIV
jgi:ATP-binding cassette subfamily B protein